ncbi:hypothetical protein HF086_012675 [Spodoptera exigua]|uniref:GST N-terminal domain-containing protein n=1 Tax=Spodoptera exigua TaxID=7107 RepID=A0A922SLC8_SPOEX|nr:hypothetical protein HF086_012675 [Spodoptera exigua]
MEDGDLILHDSHAILPYLADTYGKDDSWYPKNIKKRALVNQKLIFDAVIICARARSITGQVVMTGKKTIEKELLNDALEGYSFLEAFLSQHLKEISYCKKYNEEGANALAALVKSRVA